MEALTCTRNTRTVLAMWRKEDLDREDVIRELKEKQGDQSLRAYASSIGCTASCLNDVYSGRREPGPTILNALGLERRETVIYHRKPIKKNRRWR